jgi:hypothetical protein
VGLYQRPRDPGESALAFLRRVDLAAVKSALAGLEVSADAAAPEDFIDLAEEHEFTPAESLIPDR